MVSRKGGNAHTPPGPDDLASSALGCSNPRDAADPGESSRGIGASQSIRRGGKRHHHFLVSSADQFVTSVRGGVTASSRGTAAR